MLKKSGYYLTISYPDDIYFQNTYDGFGCINYCIIIIFEILKNKHTFINALLPYFTPVGTVIFVCTNFPSQQASLKLFT